MIVNESCLSPDSRKQFKTLFSVGFYMFWDTRDSHEMRLRTERFSLHPCLGLITIYCLESLFLWMFSRFVMKLSISNKKWNENIWYSKGRKGCSSLKERRKKTFDLNLLLISLSSVSILGRWRLSKTLTWKAVFSCS